MFTTNHWGTVGFMGREDKHGVRIKDTIVNWLVLSIFKVCVIYYYVVSLGWV